MGRKCSPMRDPCGAAGIPNRTHALGPVALSLTRWTPGKSAWRGLPDHFRMAPRVRREHRQIHLFSGVLTLNEQEAASGDAERVRFLVGHLAVGRRDTVQIDLDRYDRASL